MKNQALKAVVIFFYLLSFFCFGRDILAQNGEWAVFNKTNSGLPDNTVFSVKVDKEHVNAAKAALSRAPPRLPGKYLIEVENLKPSK